MSNLVLPLRRPLGGAHAARARRASRRDAARRRGRAECHFTTRRASMSAAAQALQNLARAAVGLGVTATAVSQVIYDGACDGREGNDGREGSSRAAGTPRRRSSMRGNSTRATRVRANGAGREGWTARERDRGR